MTETTKTEKAVFKIHINGSIDDVWKELTKTHEPQGAIFNMQMHTTEIAVGAPMQMRTKNNKYTGMVGSITVCEPPHRFGYTLRFTHLDDPECNVLCELEEADGGVNFTMTIPDLPVGTKTGKQMQQGGNMICKTLKAIIETGKPSLGTRMLYKLFKLMEPMSPKSTRVEHWPLG